MKKVIIFRNDLLPRSETFIKEQARFLGAWKPVLVGYAQVKDGLDLGELEAKIVPGAGAGTMGRYSLRLHQLLGRPHPATIATLRSIGADLVHAHFGTDATDIWPSVKKTGVPMLVTLHGYDINIHREWWEAGHGGIHRRAYPRRLLQMARDPAVHFVAVSQAIKCRAIEFGIREDKISVCYIGVDTDQFKPGGLPISQRRDRLLFVGRMVEKKAPLQLIRAFSEVRKQVPDAELVMIGDGPLLIDAKKLARELAIPVELMGAQNSNIVYAQMHLARALCLPSVTAENGDAEGFGLVLLEAQASGVPVVSSAKGGAYEGILDGKTGFSFPEHCMMECAKHLTTLLSNTKLLSTASHLARQFMEDQFSIKLLAKELETIYSSLAETKREPEQ